MKTQPGDFFTKILTEQNREIEINAFFDFAVSVNGGVIERSAVIKGYFTRICD